MKIVTFKTLIILTCTLIVAWKTLECVTKFINSPKGTNQRMIKPYKDMLSHHDLQERKT